MWLDFSLSVLQSVAWPLLIGCSVIVFRKELRGLLENVESAKLAGVETTFYRRVLEDPSTSDEIKDAAARLWLDATVSKGQPAPHLASEQLDQSKRRRGGPASPEIVKAVADTSYAEQVGQALKRISEGRINVGYGQGLHIQGAGYQNSSFIARDEHGQSPLWIYAKTNETEVRQWAGIGPIYFNEPGGDMPDILVVSPFEVDAPNFRTVCWKSAADDEKLADVLEDANLFDFVNQPQEPQR